MSEFKLVDPNIFTLLIGVIYGNITIPFNDKIELQLTEDNNKDGDIDLTIISQFNTDQPSYITSHSLNVSAIDGTCPFPLFSEACEINTSPQNSVATTFSETEDCLGPLKNTTSGYTPAPNISNAPCFATLPLTSSLNFGGVDINFQDFQQAARYPGDLKLDNGLFKGFISETEAQNIVFPAETPVIGGQSLASLLPGGLGSCSNADDRDIFTDGKTSGWWFYFNTESDIIELQESSGK